MEVRKSSYALFLEKLPRALAKIDEHNDAGRLTPVFREHTRKMLEFSEAAEAKE